jgi:dephospho-CoA kinase
MITLGVAGGIGSGKTALTHRLATHPGVRVVRADDAAKRLMVADPDVRAQIAARFGADAYTPDGALDRAHIAAQAFADDAALADLNAIVHPALRRAMLGEIDRARAEGVRLLVYEAALLFETGADALLDHVALVDAPLATRLARAAARDGATTEQVRARARHQIDPAEARRRADTVIDNGGDLDALHVQADALARRLLA